jgi:molybdopterin/thiamine biosynthesis adenylyltransferase
MMIEGADARLIESPGLGRDELARLHRATVAVIGLGVLGGQVSHHLALLGVGQVVIDCGRVEAENLGNQGFPVAQLGAPKSAARARQIAALNPDCTVRAIGSRVEDLGLAALADVDLIVTGLDSRAARVRVNELTWRWGIPWVDAAVDGTGRWLHGTVTAFDPRLADSPCYLCRYGANDLVRISREGRGPGCPNPLHPEVPVTPPTLQASAFGGIIAGLQTLYATRLLLGTGEDLVGRQLRVDCSHIPQIRSVGAPRNPRCIFDHRPFLPLATAPGPSVGDVLAAAARDLGSEPNELALHGRTLVTGLKCPACGTTRDVVRVAGTFPAEELSCACGRSAEMDPAGLSNHLSADEAQRQAACTWQDLGVPVADVVTARAGARTMHYVVNDGVAGGTWGAEMSSSERSPS